MNVKRKNDERASARRHCSVCEATLFGSTLKSVLTFAGIDTSKKRETILALREVLQFLDPISATISSITGNDQPHLVKGLAIHKVSSEQRKLLPECSRVDKHTWFCRTDLKNVILGVAASVLVAHLLMAIIGVDATVVATNLTTCVDVVCNLLREWNGRQFTHSSMDNQAIGAEIRALERARAARVIALKVATDTGLDALSSLHVQLSYMRNAAWPSDTDCGNNVKKHIRVVGKLQQGVSPRCSDVEPQAPSMPRIPILQLLHSIRTTDDGDGDGDGGSDWSSQASSSTGSASSVDSQQEFFELTNEAGSSLMSAVERMSCLLAR